MPEKTIAGKTVQVDEEGYLTDHTQWTKEMAAELAQEVGIDSLTDDHWKVIDFLQKDYEAKGKLPSIRRIKKVGDIPTKELYDLFPGGPLKKASKIAGFQKPASCV